MAQPRAISEAGPWRGLHSALDLGDIPPGGSPDQENIVNVPGNSAAWEPRRGCRSLVNEDRLPAPFVVAFDVWVAATAYTIGLRRLFSNVAYECTVAHTSNADFNVDLAALRWREITDLVDGADGRAGDIVYAYEGTHRITESYKAVALWSTGVTYPDGDYILYRADDPRGAAGQGGLVWKSVGSNLSGTFIDDVNAGKWTRVSTEQKTTGVVVSRLGLEDGPLFQILSSGQDDPSKTLLTGTFSPRQLFAIPSGFQGQTSTPQPPSVRPEAPVYAYFGNFRDDGIAGLCNITRIDINPFSGLVGTGSTQDLTADERHRPWIVKGADNRCYWLFWKSVNGQSQDAATRTRFGTWDGTTLDDNSFKTTFEGQSDGQHYANDFDEDDVPRFMAVRNSGEMVLSGIWTPGAKPKPTRPPVALNPSTGVEIKDSIAWSLPHDALPDELFTSNGVVSGMFDHKQDNLGYPHFIALNTGGFLYCVTDNATDSAGMNVRQITWGGTFPFVGEGTSKLFTTSDEPTKGSGDATRKAASRNSFNSGNKVCLVTPDTYAVARGTSGFSIASVSGGTATNFSIANTGSTDVVGVCGDTRNDQLYVADEASGPTMIIRRYSPSGVVSGVPWTSSDYAALGGVFRGMFMDRRQLFLCVLTYDTGETEGERNRLTCIPVGITDWVTSTAYNVGDLVVESDRVYQCLVKHTSGTFNTDRTNLNWGENGDVTDAKTISHTLSQTTLGYPLANDDNFWAFLDSAGSQLINMAQVPIS